MAKSVGNIARVGDLLDAGVSPRALRYALISAHYRASLELHGRVAGHGRRGGRSAGRASFSPSPLTARTGQPTPTLERALETARMGFEAALDDDLNVSPALAAVFDLVRDLNRRIDARTMSTADAGRAWRPCATSTRSWRSRPMTRCDRLSTELEALLEKRVAARSGPGLGRLGPAPRPTRGARDPGRGLA